ncbi:hypothetical protein NXZ18_26360, partial [Escherichia coli]|nr:hypothetical protein [Escherichia coli]
MAAEPQTGRREVSALTDARKTLAYDFFRILRAPLEKEYPHLDVDKRDVYLRLKAIAVSKYSSVLIDDSTRPRRFQ